MCCSGIRCVLGHFLCVSEQNNALCHASDLWQLPYHVRDRVGSWVKIVGHPLKLIQPRYRPTFSNNFLLATGGFRWRSWSQINERTVVFSSKSNFPEIHWKPLESARFLYNFCTPRNLPGVLPLKSVLDTLFRQVMRLHK
jgi:hypothetical protein